MKQYDKRKKQRNVQNNGDYIATLKGTASALPPKQLFSNPVKQPTLQRQPTQQTPNSKGQTQEIKPESREYQYQIALALANYEPTQVEGFDEFKPDGFRYNPSKSYNLAILEQQSGHRPVGVQKLGEYWADPSTEAGRVMKTQHHSHGRKLLYGKTKETYQPSDELLSRQAFQQLGEEQVRTNTIATLQYCQAIKKAIRLKINDQACPIAEKNNYLAKDTKMDATINQLLAAIGGVSEQEAPEVSEANFAMPIRWALSATLGAALMAGTAMTLLVTVLFREVHETLEDVVDSALDDLLRKTGVGRNDKEEPNAQPNKKPKPVPPNGETKDEKECKPQPVGYHLGHDRLHNMVADKEPPNDQDQYGRLGDWKLNGHHFDAYNRGKRELWEVKTIRFEECNEFVKEMELQKQIKQINIDNMTAVRCGFQFVFLTTSKENYEMLEKRLEGKGLDIRFTDRYKIR